MEDILEKVEHYWDGRSEGYCKVNIDELKSDKKYVWKNIIKINAPNVKERKLKVLDIGTGPGFFAIIMSSLGYEVTAIDYTQAMIEKAEQNAGIYKEHINFKRMDAHELEFKNDTFDLIVTRNLTWNLSNPEVAYKDWHRVLVPGGKLINFDANWYLHLYDKKKREEYEEDRNNVMKLGHEDHYTCTDIDEMENIARELPLSKIERPKWDINILSETGFTEIIVENNIGEKTWSDEEKINYGSTPMFMIVAQK